MNFRVGAEPRATGVYIKVHEDCERVKATPPENSWAKTIYTSSNFLYRIRLG